MNSHSTLPKALSSAQTKRRRCGVLLAGVLALAASFSAVSVRAQAVDPAAVPEAKRTKAGHYLWASDVPDFLKAKGSPGKLLFLDLRTRAEAMYVGMPTGVDALVPYVEHQELMTDWDAKRANYRLEPLQDFMPEVHRRLQEKGLSKSDVVVLICRSGDRSARAANRLMEDGFTQVWSVVDGFEGDMSKDGRRSVNGWKNAGLPWSYKLERERMYFPR